MSRGGLPHSEIFGSKPVCGSPKLFAAYRVLHRLLAPRHSPYALSSLTIRNSGTIACTGSGIRDSGFEAPCPRIPNPEPRVPRPDSPNAHCVCVVGKLPFAEYSVVKEPSSRPGIRDPGFGIRRTSPRVPSPEPRLPNRVRNVSKNPPSPFGLRRAAFAGLPTVARSRLARSDQASAERRLVENTGLEPATSWLQTRRSPS